MQCFIYRKVYNCSEINIYTRAICETFTLYYVNTLNYRTKKKSLQGTFSCIYAFIRLKVVFLSYCLTSTGINKCRNFLSSLWATHIDTRVVPIHDIVCNIKTRIPRRSTYRTVRVVEKLHFRYYTAHRTRKHKRYLNVSRIKVLTERNSYVFSYKVENEIRIVSHKINNTDD